MVTAIPDPNNPQDNVEARSGAAYRRKEKLRQQGIKSSRELAAGAQGVVAAAEEGRTRFNAQAADRQAAIRSGAAQGLAAAAPTGQLAAGGGFLGAAGQAGLDATTAGIRQSTADDATLRGLDQGIAAARMGASQAAMADAEYAASAGSADEDYTQAMTQAEVAIEQAMSENLDQGWYMNDDEEAVNKAVRAEVAKLRLINPQAAAVLEAKYLTAGSEGFERIYE